jgi:hypothetical protein
MAIDSMKVPAAVATGGICLALGVGAGVLLMGLFGYQARPKTESTAESSAGPPPGGGGGMMGGPPGGGGGMMGGRPGGGPPGGGGGMMGRGPSAATQLAGLVTKLDQVTEKPLTVNLSSEQKARVREQLKDLADKEELSDDEAKERLDKLLEILKDDKDTLVAAGYRWPGDRGGPGGGFGGGSQPKNPFKEGDASARLKALQERVAK